MITVQLTTTQKLALLRVKMPLVETASFKKRSSATKVEITTWTPVLVGQVA